MRICAIGDLLLDVVVRLDSGIALDTDTYGRSRIGAGGQAANVAAWTAKLGGKARFLGKRALDPVGRLLTAELEGRGVEVVGPEADSGTGVVVAIATPDGRRTMLTDRGIAPELAPEELRREWLDDCDVLHVPGYSLARAPLRDAALAAARTVQRVTVDASSTAALGELGPTRFRGLLEELQPEVVFATDEEAVFVGPVESATLVIKRGARGCVVRQRGGEAAYPAIPAAAADSTGAGDAFAAGYLLGGPRLALQAAARCVAKLGAMP